jgi:hypothetical protein
LQLLVTSWSERRKILNLPLMKIAMSLVDPDEKGSVTDSFFDNQIHIAVVVDIQRRYGKRLLRRLKRQLRIRGVGQMKLYFEASVIPAGIQKNSAIGFLITIEVRNRQIALEWSRESGFRQGAPGAVLRPRARRHQGQRRGNEKLDVQQASLHSRI